MLFRSVVAVSCSSPYSAGPSGSRHFGHTSCEVPGFYRQLPPCMSSRHRSPNTMLRDLIDVAAKRWHVEGSLTFSNAFFRSDVRYIMGVMIAAFTRSARHFVPKLMRTPILRSFSYRPRISYFSFEGNACWQAQVYALGGLRKGILRCFRTFRV